MQRLLLRLSVGVTTAMAVGLLALLALSMSPAGALALRGYALTASGFLLVSGPNAQDNCEPATGPATGPVTGPVTSVSTGLPITGGGCCPPPATGPATEPATGPATGPPNPCGGQGGGGPGTGPATGPSTGPPPGKCEPEKDKKADKAEADREKHDTHKGSIADLPKSLLSAVQRFLDSSHRHDRDCDNDQDSEDTGGG